MDPYLTFRFRIIVGQIIEGGFTEASGLQATTQVEEFREGGLNSYVHKLPKETKFDNLTLKRGLGDSIALWKWHREVVAGIFKRQEIQIQLLGRKEQSEPLKIWTFKEAYPIKWSGPEFKSEGNTVAFESLEIAHNGYVDR